MNKKDLSAILLVMNFKKVSIQSAFNAEQTQFYMRGKVIVDLSGIGGLSIRTSSKNIKQTGRTFISEDKFDFDKTKILNYINYLEENA